METRKSDSQQGRELNDKLKGFNKNQKLAWALGVNPEFAQEALEYLTENGVTAFLENRKYKL